MTSIESPRSDISLAELRVFIDQANALILAGLQLCLADTEEPVVFPEAYIMPWAAELVTATIPQAVIEHLVQFLNQSQLHDQSLAAGLTIINHGLQVRFAATRKVGQLKSEHNMPVLDSAREDAIIQSMETKISAAALPEELIQLFAVIMEVVRDEHSAYAATTQE